MIDASVAARARCVSRISVHWPSPWTASTTQKRLAGRRRSTLILLALALLAAGCKRQADDLSPDGNDAVAVSAVGHLGSNVGISEYYIDKGYFGSVPGWGGGGKSSCCVLVPSKITKPVVIHVRWETCDTSHIRFENGIAVDPNARCKLEEHDADVPIQFADETGSTLYMHFLPGDRVEAWVSSYFPEGRNYPGPAYPRGPAPLYKPKASQPATAISDK